MLKIVHIVLVHSTVFYIYVKMLRDLFISELPNISPTELARNDWWLLIDGDESHLLGVEL